jgi:hypothetical protein
MSGYLEDLKNENSQSFEDGNYFIFSFDDLDVNTTYRLQFRWAYKDGSYSKAWSATKLITTPGESSPNTPSFISSDVDISQPEKLIITYRGVSDDVTPVAITDIDRVDVYISGSPFDGLKPAHSFKEAGTQIIPAPAGTYQIVLYAISKLGLKSPVSSAVTKTVVAAGVPIQTPTLPSGLSVATAPFAVTVNWNGTYSSSTFTGFKSIDIYAVGSNLGSSVTSGISATNLVGSLTVNDITNRINIGLDNLRQALGLSTNSDVYSATIFYYYNAVNLNNEKYGSPTYTRINSSSVVPTKANFIDLASGVISIENLVAGNGQFSSWLRTGTSGGARIELSAVSDFSNGGNTVQKGLVAYSSGNTEIFNLDLDAGSLTINGSGTFTGNLTAGTGNSIFKSDSSGIYLGNAVFASAPFSVSRNGVIKSESGTIGGWTLGADYLQGNNIKLQTGQILIGSTSQPYFDISPTALTHRNANGTASGKFTLTLGSSSQLTLDGTLTINGSSIATDAELSSGLATKIGGADVNSNVTSISGGVITTGTINLNNVNINNGTGNNSIRISSSGLELYNNVGTRTVYLNPTNGDASFTGAITGSTVTGGIVRTAQSGDRIELNNGSYLNELSFWTNATNPGRIYAYTSGSNGVMTIVSPYASGSTSANINIYSLGANSYIDLSANLVAVTGSLGANSFYTGSPTSDETATSTGTYIANAGYITARRTGAAPIYSHRTEGGTGPLRAMTFYSGGVFAGGINMYTNQIAQFVNPSDYRLKENIEDYTNASEIIKRSRLRKFNFKTNPEKEIVGFIAHEYAEVSPDFVIGEKDAVDENGNPIYQEMMMGSINPYLIGALKESILRIEELEQRLDALEG